MPARPNGHVWLGTCWEGRRLACNEREARTIYPQITPMTLIRNGDLLGTSGVSPAMSATNRQSTIVNGFMSFPFADLDLAKRLELTEAQGNAEFVDARAAASPDLGATWAEIAGTFAMFDGKDSPVTQTFCLGMFKQSTNKDFEEIEQFFQARGAPVFHEVCPLADPSTFELLSQRGYKVVEVSNVLFRPIDRQTEFAGKKNKDIVVRRIAKDEHQLWAKTAQEGWSEYKEAAEFMAGLASVTAKRKSGLAFLAELDSEAIATGALTIHEGVALLAGASTVPERRKLGAQLALLEGRIRYAVEEGCELAMMAALPGSASQRNAERQGFRIAYTRFKWHLNQQP